MSRTLTFPETGVGQVYLATEGQQEQVAARGSINVPAGAKAFLLLGEAAPADLLFLAGLDSDVVVGVKLKQVDATGIARLARQSELTQASLGTLRDADLVQLAALPLAALEVTLSDLGDAGLARLAAAPLTSLTLHGNPGTALGSLAHSATLEELHLRVESLGLAQLRDLATSTHLQSLSVEVVETVDSTDADVVDALVAVASGLTALDITKADGSSGLADEVHLAVLRATEGLTLNGVTYAPAAIARLERKLVSA